MTYSFDVDFECVQSKFGRRVMILFKQTDSLILEEVLHRWISNYAVISLTIGVQSALHVLLVVMAANDLLLRQLHYTLD